ncbi:MULTISPECIES: preprotein translocase subunit YajC [Glycomyces]|uniref:Preprotein translocase subunit YajC n=2 Tax=Glycomyces TaxID=58113 RepID=A0A9X3SVD3_9ACTN|nr:preprotein translocase subunit YajC [Glycomyces lechevalierae]MDA1386535.1 preprotein translocase subunit YajC [Glycomyces lechevalierae]MDR7340602.1 preprotein translocase subunit YajC [Glycomyces lechevalierae]
MLASADVLAQQSGGGSNIMFLIMIVGFIALMYFVMIRPQRKRQKEQQDMQSNVAPGARVMTIGGLYGTVVDSDDETITLEASDETFLVFARQAIAKVVTPAETVEATEEAPAEEISEADATLSDEDLDKLRASDDATDEDDKGKHAGNPDRKEY